MIGGAVFCLRCSASCLSAEGLADRICPDFDQNMSRTQKGVYELDLALHRNGVGELQTMSPPYPELPLSSEIR
jgi:hypothetical protein